MSGHGRQAELKQRRMLSAEKLLERRKMVELNH